MWQLGINTKFHQESRSFIFRPRLLLQRGAEYYVTTLIAQAMALIASNQHPEYEVDVPSCFISPETCRGSSGHSLYATPIKTLKVQTAELPCLGHDGALSLATDPHGMLGHFCANGSTCVRRCFSTSGSPESNNPSESPIFPFRIQVSFPKIRRF